MVHCLCSLIPSQIITIEQPHFQSNIWYIARIIQICLVPVGNEDLAGGLEPIRNGEIF